MSERCCGTCQLWSPNLFPRSKVWDGHKRCCADTVMDLPASCDPLPDMEADRGADCAIWEPRS